MYVDAEIPKNQQPEIVSTFKVTAYIIYFDFHFCFHLCHDENWTTVIMLISWISNRQKKYKIFKLQYDSSIKENSKHIALSLSVPTIHTDTNLSIFHNYGLPTLLKYVLSVLNRLKTTQKDKPYAPSVKFVVRNTGLNAAYRTRICTPYRYGYWWFSRPLPCQLGLMRQIIWLLY